MSKFTKSIYPIFKKNINFKKNLKLENELKIKNKRDKLKEEKIRSNIIGTAIIGLILLPPYMFIRIFFNRFN